MRGAAARRFSTIAAAAVAGGLLVLVVCFANVADGSFASPSSSPLASLARRPRIPRGGEMDHFAVSRRMRMQRRSPPAANPLRSAASADPTSGAAAKGLAPSAPAAAAAALSSSPPLPPPSPPCVYGVAPRTGPLNEAVARVAGVSLGRANALIEIGAVWARLEALGPGDLLDLYDDGGGGGNDGSTRPSSRKRDSVSSSRALYADIDRRAGSYDEDDDEGGEAGLDGYVARMERVRYRRVLVPAAVDAGADLRVYPNPRRFEAECREQADRRRLLHEDTTFLVVDKPPLLPTQPDASNYAECCPGCVGAMAGDGGPPFADVRGEPVARPYLCHRVDRVVGGCVVLAKDRNGQNVFLRMQRDRKVRKVYLAVTRRPVPVGQHVHWMWSPQSARGKVGGPPCQLVRRAVPESRRKAREFWRRCVLQVAECRPITIDPAALRRNRPAGYGDGDDGSGDCDADASRPVYYQSVIRLVTGRKHQVRAQLASLGCPILFDTLYEPMAGLTLDDLDGSDGSGGIGADAEEDEQDGTTALDRALSRCRAPATPIGLQAHAISFGGVRAIARSPWWAAAPAAAKTQAKDATPPSE